VVEGAEAVGEAADLLDQKVDGFGAAVGDASCAGLGGVEAGHDVGLPGPQRSAQAGDLRDRAGRERGDDVLGEPPAPAGIGLLVDRSDALIGVPGQGDLPVRVAGLQTGVQLGQLTLAEVLGAAAQ
jgi:hypothetical protein